ncbi:hypothetical protein AB6880_03650 [Rahnella inusitata]|uniref:hypothetical protein n=1 Tax=Rahnella inusitata TaxID=58169 RepID=UPI0039BE29ED
MAGKEKLCVNFLKTLKHNSPPDMDLGEVICVSDKRLMRDLKNIKINRMVNSVNPFHWK